jgi:phage-related protein
MAFDIRGELLLNMANWQKNLNKASKQTEKFGKNVKTVANGVKGAVVGLGAAVLTGFVGEWIDAAEKARQADQRLEQVAKTMNLFGGDLPGVTGKMKEFAETLEVSTGFQAEQVKQVQSTLLTFKQIGRTAGVTGGIFDRTTEAALDLAAAGFGSVESNAKQLGKALENPLKGLSSLTRAGVTFTKKEENKIRALVKSNKLSEAQAIILEAVEKQVGGVAEATGLTSDKLKNAFGQITDEIGAQFLPMMDKMVKWFQSSEGKKAIQVWIDKINEIGAYFNSPEFGEALNTWVKRIEGLLKFIGSLLDGLNEFLDAVTGNTKSEGQKRSEKYYKPGESTYQEGRFGTTVVSYSEAKRYSAAAMERVGSTPNSVVNNITITAPNVSGQAVIDALKKNAKSKGVPLGKMLIN